MRKQILSMIERNARLSDERIAEALGCSTEEVRAEIRAMERAGIIRGYNCVIDWEQLEGAPVCARIELKVQPKAGQGFEDVAELIAGYPEVESVSLMSGACDLSVTLRGKSFREISDFVAKELAFIDGVTSTSTQFVMRRYKEFGVELNRGDEDGRCRVSL